MYDWPEVRGATAELEDALQRALTGVLGLSLEDIAPWPEEMDLESMWLHPGLLLSQTCGYPLTHALTGKVAVVGVPHYDTPGCHGPEYCSQIVVHRNSDCRTIEDLRGKRAVYNGNDSQSGMNAFRHAVARIAGGKPFFESATVSGSHLASLKAVAGGTVDVASVDAVCWQLAVRELPDLAGQLKPIARTASVPGLPFVTSLLFSDRDRELILQTVTAVLSAPETHKSRERLGIRGFSSMSPGAYAGIVHMEQEAKDLGYPCLR